MALSVVKTDKRGTYRMVAESDLYLDKTMTKVIVVGEGEDVPNEAAFVLTAKGGTIPARYRKLVEGLDEVDKAKPEPEPPAPKPLPEVPAEPVAEAEVKPEAEPVPEPKPAKTKKQ